MDFESVIKKVIIPSMKEHGLTKCTVQNSLGDKAQITRNKHGFFKIKYTYEESNRV